MNLCCINKFIYFIDADFAGGKGNNRKVQAIGERVISNGGLDACPDNSSSIVSFGLLSLGVLLFALFWFNLIFENVYKFWYYYNKKIFYIS